MKLHHEILGSGQIDLVLLHGWGWHSGIWDPLIPYLQDEFRLHLIDLPGYGRSSVLKYSLESIAETIIAEISYPAIWLGWSLGGLIAWWVAIHYPKLVTRLITVCSSPKFLSESGESSKEINWPGIDLLTLNKFYLHLQNDHQKTLTDFLELQLRGSKNRSELFQNLKEKLFKYSLPNQDILHHGLKILEKTDLRNQLVDLKVTSLHIFGRLDTIVPVTVASELQNLKNVNIKIFDKSGHMPFLTHTNEFADLLYLPP